MGDENKWMEDEGNGGNVWKETRKKMSIGFCISRREGGEGGLGVKLLNKSSVGKRVWLSWLKNDTHKKERSAVYR